MLKGPKKALLLFLILNLNLAWNQKKNISNGAKKLLMEQKMFPNKICYKAKKKC